MSITSSGYIFNLFHQNNSRSYPSRRGQRRDVCLGVLVSINKCCDFDISSKPLFYECPLLKLQPVIHDNKLIFL